MIILAGDLQAFKENNYKKSNSVHSVQLQCHLSVFYYNNISCINNYLHVQHYGSVLLEVKMQPGGKYR